MQTAPSVPSGAPVSGLGTRRETDLQRLEAKLDRIEARLAAMLDPVPQVVATATETVDDFARQHPELRLDERLPAALELVERLTRPEVMRQLTQLIEVAERAPQAFATFTEVMDDIARDAAAQGLDLDASLHSVGQMLKALVQISPDLTAFFESGGHRTIAELSNAMAAARESETKVGAFGALKAMRDPAVQRSLGFAIELAKAFGNGRQQIEVKQLPPAG